MKIAGVEVSTQTATDILTGCAQKFWETVKKYNINGNFPLFTGFSDLSGFLEQKSQAGDVISVGFDNTEFSCAVPSTWASWVFNVQTPEFLDWKKSRIEPTLNNIESISNMLETYNSNVSGLNMISKFTSEFANCLVEPMKFVFNFGNNKFNFDTYFDMDISININDENEKSNAVGWRCGYTTTKYLDWITKDHIFGGPEIVLVDIDKYKIFNPTKEYLEIPVHVCWFNETQIESVLPLLTISWHGYEYVVPLNNLQYNSNCCQNLLVIVKINLVTNEITYSYPDIIPVISCLNPAILDEVYAEDFSLNLGYIICNKSDFINVDKRKLWQQLDIQSANKNFVYFAYIGEDFKTSTTNFVQRLTALTSEQIIMEKLFAKLHELNPEIGFNDLNNYQIGNEMSGNWVEKVKLKYVTQKESPLKYIDKWESFNLNNKHLLFFTN
jgi:hypothetical protein